MCTNPTKQNPCTINKTLALSISSKSNVKHVVTHNTYYLHHNYALTLKAIIVQRFTSKTDTRKTIRSNHLALVTLTILCAKKTSNMHHYYQIHSTHQTHLAGFTHTYYANLNVRKPPSRDLENQQDTKPRRIRLISPTLQSRNCTTPGPGSSRWKKRELGKNPRKRKEQKTQHNAMGMGGGADLLTLPLPPVRTALAIFMSFSLFMVAEAARPGPRERGAAREGVAPALASPKGTISVSPPL